MSKFIYFADKNGEAIFLLTNLQCFVIGLFIVIGGVGLVIFGLYLIRTGFIL